MEIINALSETRASHWKDSAIWLAYVLLGGLLPIWGGALFLRAISKPLAISYFIDNGELAIYSASILSPTLYLILKDFKTSIFANRHIFALISLLFLLVSSFLFTSVIAASAGTFQVDQLFLRRWTIIVYIVSACLAFIVTVIDQSRSTKDIRTYHAKEFQELRERFGDTGGDEE